MNLRHIETFNAVMQTLSMTRAAELLHTSQSNISRTIGQLQRETGLRLFDRVGLRLVATPEAEALLKEVKRVYVSVDTISEAAERIRRLGAEGLRVAVSPALGTGLIPRALAAFRKRRPGISVTVHTSDSATICKWTEAGYCDFGLVAYVALPQGVEEHLLHRERAVCIVPDGHRLAGYSVVTPDDLAGECFISMPTTDRVRRAIDDLFVPETRRLELETSHAATICLMVAQGLGVSIVNPMLHRALALNNVVPVPFEPAMYFECHSVHAKHRLEQAIVPEFIETVQRVLKGEGS